MKIKCSNDSDGMVVFSSKIHSQNSFKNLKSYKMNPIIDVSEDEVSSLSKFGPKRVTQKYEETNSISNMLKTSNNDFSLSASELES
mmetsp:Transcript_11516/g.10192  ORF Transcript_11516/g.10192 Transcript_11516/m.10192 type:complete len:86 (-) Transcript_11516:42-299(-)